MADKLKLPFEFPPNGKVDPAWLQANLNQLRDFIQNVNDGLESLTNLVITTLNATNANVSGTVDAGTLDAGSASVTGTLDADTVDASTVTATDVEADDSLQVGTAGATLDANATTGQVKQSAQTSFTAIYPSAVGGVNKTGPLSAVEYSTNDFSVGAAYNNSTYTFTAPVAGKYLFMASADVASRAGTPVTLFRINLVTTSYTYRSRYVPSGTTPLTLQVQAIVSMAANDTAKVSIDVGAAGETWNIGGLINGIFSGSLIN